MGVIREDIGALTTVRARQFWAYSNTRAIPASAAALVTSREILRQVEVFHCLNVSVCLCSAWLAITYSVVCADC